MVEGKGERGRMRRTRWNELEGKLNIRYWFPGSLKEEYGKAVLEEGGDEEDQESAAGEKGGEREESEDEEREKEERERGSGGLPRRKENCASICVFPGPWKPAVGSLWGPL
eukprot:3941735-Pyramimonas_sp.AAC.1